MVAVAVTPIDFGRVGLVNSSGPDLIKWALRGPLWYLPLLFIVPRWIGLFTVVRRPPSSWYLAWVLLGCASVVWAEAPSQAVLIGFGVAGLATLGTWYAYVYGWEAFASAVMIGLTICVGAGLLLDAAEGLIPAERLTGLTTGPTTQGRLAAFGLVLAGGLIGNKNTRNSVWLASAAVLGVSLWLTGTRTAMGAALFGLLYGGFRGMRRQDRTVVLASLMLVLVMAYTGLSASGGAVADLGERNDPTSVSGRTDVWPIALDFIQERPLFGYGMGAEERLFAQAANAGDLYFLAGTSHSMVLTTWLSGGVVGFTLFFMSVVSSIRHRKRVDPWVFAPIPVVVIGGITEAVVQVPTVSILLLAGCFATIARASRWS